MWFAINRFLDGLTEQEKAVFASHLGHLTKVRDLSISKVTVSADLPAPSTMLMEVYKLRRLLSEAKRSMDLADQLLHGRATEDLDADTRLLMEEASMAFYRIQRKIGTYYDHLVE